MPGQTCNIRDLAIGGLDPAGSSNSLCIIAGPCVLEDPETNHKIASTLVDICASLDLPLIFKASFDKANRSSIRSARGPAIEAGLRTLAEIRSTYSVPVTTDIHEPGQAALAARSVDLLQIPAFLCRQTDLLVACAETGVAVNVKKGQFLAPAEMRHTIRKLTEGGCREIMLTERGTTFGYHRLVNDFVGLGDLMELGPPVCFDVTHSTQLPGAGEETTGGRPERAALLARAAVAAGVDALFIECHPDPPRAQSDAGTQQPLEAMPALLEMVARVRAACVASATPSRATRIRP